MNAKQFDVDHISKLARIELTEEEKIVFAEQMSSIVEYCEQISEINTDGVEPMVHAFSEMYNLWDEDEPIEPMSTDKVLMNAPEEQDNHIVVPNVI